MGMEVRAESFGSYLRDRGILPLAQLEKATQVMEACSFQDLTGQRVSRIIRSMKFVEQRVEARVEIFGRTAIEKLASRLPVEEVDIKDGMVLHGPDLPGEAISQEEIDNLFS